MDNPRILFYAPTWNSFTYLKRKNIKDTNVLHEAEEKIVEIIFKHLSWFFR